MSKLQNRLLILAALCCVSGKSALTVQITSVGQTQAVMVERGFSGPCTIVVSSSQSLTPLHPDVNGTEYSGASTDTGRADTIISADGLSRTVIIGHPIRDRALANYTAYYYSISGCGTATGSFVTANLSSGTTRTESAPYDASQWGNLGFPTFDWTSSSKSYVMPDTGAILTPMSTTQLTWRTDGGGSGPQSCITNTDCPTFADWSGGSGWTNPGNTVNGVTSNATTTNTNVLDLYANISGNPIPYGFPMTLGDVSAVVFGSCSGCTNPTDKIINICIILNPVSGCASNTIAITVGTSGIAHVLSGSGDPDQPFPAAFPAIPYFGWTGSVSPLIRGENQVISGTLSATNSTLTITNPGPANHFSSALTTGAKIFITGTSPTCTNNLCTLAAPPNAGTATIVENLGPFGTAAFRAYGWGIRVWKNTAVGTASIGLNYKLAGSILPLGAPTKCSSVAVTSADNLTGYICQIQAFQPGFGFQAFISTTGVTRLLSTRYGVSFDSTLGNVSYLGVGNGSSGWTIQKLTYTGDYLTNLVPNNFGCGTNFACPAFTDSYSSVDLMPHVSSLDLNQQVVAHQGGTLPTYNPTLYGDWTQGNSNVHQDGGNGHFFYFANSYSGQAQAGGGGGAGWVAVVDVSTNPAVVTRLIHTLDGTDFPNARFSGLHSPQPLDGKDNTLFLSLDELNANNSSTLFGGPYEVQVSDILLSVGPLTWSGTAGGAGAGTCLYWPYGTIGTSGCAAANYYNSCPTALFTCTGWPTANGIPYVDIMTIRLPQGGVCAVNPTAAELAFSVCPYNAAFGHYPTIQVGDNAHDPDPSAPDPNGGYDAEHFRFLEGPIVGGACGAGKECWLVARVSVPVYCAPIGFLWQGHTNPDAGGSIFQDYHVNGWRIRMSPGTWNTCQAGVMLQDQTDLTHIQELGRPYSIHFASGKGLTGGVTFVTTTLATVDKPFLNMADWPLTYNVLGAQWNGVDAYIVGGILQSYTDDSQVGVGFNNSLDTNPGVACSAEQLGCALAARTLASLGGDVYKIQSIGNAAASETTYKNQPMVGWAGRYILRDISGPSSLVDSTPWSMCFVLVAGECHAGSVANEIYVNVPQAYDAGYCTASVSWANVPCVLFGANTPAGSIRQPKIDTNDPNGAYSRWISNGWSAFGRQYPFTVAVRSIDGQWVFQGGSQLVDGFSVLSYLVSVPPWVEKIPSANGYQMVQVKIPAGHATASVRFGYSGFSGPNSPLTTFQCTLRFEACIADGTNVPFAYASKDTVTETSCTGGCSINVPAVAGKEMILQVWSAGVAVGDPWVISIP